MYSTLFFWGEGACVLISFHKTIENRITNVNELSDGCWINVVAPTESEVKYLVGELCLDNDFVRSSLDEEESSRIDCTDDQTLIIVDLATSETQNKATMQYSTMSLGVIMTSHYIITIALRPHQILTDIAEGKVKNVSTNLRTRFLLTLLLRIANGYLVYLKQIDKLSSYTENQLHQSMRNQELIQLLGLEKSLVYFSTSLKGNEITLEKILRGRTIKLYEEDQDILADVLIEIKQAIEMCNIYSRILSSTMNAFSSIISNNLNIVMKILTALTVVMAIPTIVTGFYGMNILGGLPWDQFWWSPVLISVILSLILALILYKKGMFK